MQCPSCFETGNDPYSCQFCGYRHDQSREGVYLPIGTSLHNGEYSIGRVLGRPGGFGITYLAWDTRFDIKVAIKEYLPFQIAARAADGTTISIHTPDYRADFEFGLDKFLEEAKTLAQFRHPNIVRVLNFFRENGTAYMVMDYLEGESLAEYLARVGRLTVPDAVAIIRPLLDGLSHIHARNILHRDIKPANIYLTREGQAILLDFGSARQSFRNLSKSLTAVVTPGFAPWEQYHRKGKQGPWTDVYACAATLYFMVTEIVPPDGTERLVEDDLVAIGNLIPEADGKVMDGIMKGLSVNPENRQQTVEEMVSDLAVNTYGGGETHLRYNQETRDKVEEGSTGSSKQAGASSVECEVQKIEILRTDNAESNVVVDGGNAATITSEEIQNHDAAKVENAEEAYQVKGHSVAGKPTNTAGILPLLKTIWGRQSIKRKIFVGVGVIALSVVMVNGPLSTQTMEKEVAARSNNTPNIRTAKGNEQSVPAMEQKYNIVNTISVQKEANMPTETPRLWYGNPFAVQVDFWGTGKKQNVVFWVKKIPGEAPDTIEIEIEGDQRRKINLNIDKGEFLFPFATQGRSAVGEDLFLIVRSSGKGYFHKLIIIGFYNGIIDVLSEFRPEDVADTSKYMVRTIRSGKNTLLFKQSDGLLNFGFNISPKDHSESEATRPLIPQTRVIQWNEQMSRYELNQTKSVQETKAAVANKSRYGPSWRDVYQDANGWYWVVKLDSIKRSDNGVEFLVNKVKFPGAPIYVMTMKYENQTRDILTSNVQELSSDGSRESVADVKSILLPYGELIEIVKSVNAIR